MYVCSERVVAEVVYGNDLYVCVYIYCGAVPD